MSNPRVVKIISKVVVRSMPKASLWTKLLKLIK